MADDLTQRLERLQRYAAGLQGLLAQAQEQAPPSATGQDATGSVRVEVGPDGLPESIVVGAEWRGARGADLEAAVQEAGAAAMTGRMTEWSQALEDGGWQHRADDLKRGAATGPIEVPRRAAPTAPPAGVGSGRSLSQLTGDVLDAVQHRDAIDGAPALSARGTGSSGPGGVQVTLSAAGLQSCTVPDGWVGSRSSWELTTAFGSALTAAKRELAASVAAAEETRDAAGLDGMLADALALLGDPDRLGDERRSRA